MAQGLHDRFEMPCVENNWIEFRNAILNDQPLPNDPRYVTLIVTNFGAFSGSWSRPSCPSRCMPASMSPGWFHQQSANGCPENDPPPAPGVPWRHHRSRSWFLWTRAIPTAIPPSNRNKGNVWGYFVTTVLPVPGGIVSHERCEFGELGTRAARLVE